MFARVPTVMLVAFAVVAFRDTTLVVERLEVPVTFKFVPKIEEELRVRIFAAERFETPPTFMVVATMKGIVMVSKLKIVLEEFDENAAA